MQDYENHDALGLAGLVRKGDVTAEELLDAALARIERWNPPLNAVTVDGASFARAEIAAGLPDGPLRGVPFLLKDLGAPLPGLPSNNGSRFTPAMEVGYQSETVARYRAAGLVIAGRTNTPEFGLTTTTEPLATGPTRNPWNLAYSPGGSSGGAAAAVAAGIVPAAHASDGGGSIRVPAACCGLFGLKPSRGRISVAPDAGQYWSGFAGSHVITRSVRDSAALLDATHGPAPGDPYAAPTPEKPFLTEVGTEPGRLRIALTTTPFTGVPADPEIAKLAGETARLCEELGHHVEEAAPRVAPEVLIASVWRIIAVHMACELDWIEQAVGRKAGPDDIEPHTRDFVDHGREIPAVEFQNALSEVEMIGREFGRFFEEFDVLLSPTQANPTHRLGWLDTTRPGEHDERLAQTIGFTCIMNATGCPAMSVPLHWLDGVPQGMQFAAAYGNEALLLRLAGQLEQAQPWFDRRPAFPG